MSYCLPPEVKEFLTSPDISLVGHGGQGKGLGARVECSRARARARARMFLLGIMGD